jgi:hypothetical protein
MIVARAATRSVAYAATAVFGSKEIDDLSIEMAASGPDRLTREVQHRFTSGIALLKQALDRFGGPFV